MGCLTGKWKCAADKKGLPSGNATNLTGKWPSFQTWKRLFQVSAGTTTTVSYLQFFLWQITFKVYANPKCIFQYAWQHISWYTVFLSKYVFVDLFAIWISYQYQHLLLQAYIAKAGHAFVLITATIKFEGAGWNFFFKWTNC